MTDRRGRWPTPVPAGNTYDKYSTVNPVERRLMHGFFSAFDQALPATSPRRILEVGAGEGEVAVRLRQHFPDAVITVVDLPDVDLASCWETNSLDGVFGDVETLPFPDGRFDLVLGIEMLEHVPDPAAALREFARVASGHAVFSVPKEPLWRMLNIARGKYWRQLGNTPGHVQHWSTRSFRDLVSEHFVVDQIRRPLPWSVITAHVRV